MHAILYVRNWGTHHITLCCTSCLYRVAHLMHAPCRHWQYELDRRQRGKAPRLWVAVVKLFWVKLLAQFILCAFEVCSKTLSTFMPSVCHTLSVVTAYMYSVHSVNVTQGINRYFYFSCSDRIFMWWIVCPIILMQFYYM